MTMLQAFQSTPIQVQAEFTLRGRNIELSYTLRDPNREVLDMGAPGTWTEFPRADELWKTTCFEAFWGKAGEPNYYEFNLSPEKRSWNLYAFDDYRKPQPPVASRAFDLIEVEATDNRLRALLRGTEPAGALQVSLTAIIRTAAGTHYFALKHAGTKPDFHLRNSFVLGI